MVWGLNLGAGTRFSAPVDTGHWAHSGYRVSFHGVNWPDRLLDPLSLLFEEYLGCIKCWSETGALPPLPLYAILMWEENFIFNVFYVLALYKVCRNPGLSVGWVTFTLFIRTCMCVSFKYLKLSQRICCTSCVSYICTVILFHSVYT